MSSFPTVAAATSLRGKGSGAPRFQTAASRAWAEPPERERPGAEQRDRAGESMECGREDSNL